MNTNHSPDPEGVTTVEDEAEETLVRPRFDEEAVRQARPAIAVTTRGEPGWSRIFFTVAVVAGLLGGILGSILTVRYLSAEPATVTQEKIGPPATAPARESNPVESAPQLPAPDNGGEKPQSAAAEAPADLQTPIPPRDLSAEATGEARDRDDDRRELRQAFDSWLEATNQQDIDRQMDFYNSTVNRYYRTRGASTEAVRAEKSRVFGRANTVSVEAGEPSVTLSRDGNQATILFRKRYNIEGEGVERRGEVVQELRWQRVNGQWRIVGERDVKVVR